MMNPERRKKKIAGGPATAGRPPYVPFSIGEPRMRGQIRFLESVLGPLGHAASP